MEIGAHQVYRRALVKFWNEIYRSINQTQRTASTKLLDGQCPELLLTKIVASQQLVGELQAALHFPQSPSATVPAYIFLECVCHCTISMRTRGLSQSRLPLHFVIWLELQVHRKYRCLHILNGLHANQTCKLQSKLSSTSPRDLNHISSTSNFRKEHHLIGLISHHLQRHGIISQKFERCCKIWRYGRPTSGPASI